MKRYDIRMDDADGEECATGAWVMWIDAQAALAAKDAALAELLDAMEQARVSISLSLEHDSVRDAEDAESLLERTIAKHRPSPKEGADNA